MNKLSKEKQQQLLVVVVVSLAVVGILWAFVIRAQASAKTQRMNDIEAAQKTLGDAEKLVKMAPKFKQDVDDAQVKLSKIEDTMASGDLYSWVILTINKFKSGHNVDIPSISLPERINIGLFGDFPYDAMKCALRGSAYFHDFGKFLADFENAFPHVRVQNIELAPESVSGDSEKLSFKLEVVIPLKPTEKKK